MPIVLLYSLILINPWGSFPMNRKYMFFVLKPLCMHISVLSFRFVCLMEWFYWDCEQACSHCFPGLCYVSLNSGDQLLVIVLETTWFLHPFSLFLCFFSQRSHVRSYKDVICSNCLSAVFCRLYSFMFPHIYEKKLFSSCCYLMVVINPGVGGV